MREKFPFFESQLKHCPGLSADKFRQVESCYRKIQFLSEVEKNHTIKIMYNKKHQSIKVKFTIREVP